MSYDSPAYQHYAREWLASTSRLTLAAQGALQRLRDTEWSEGPLPDDPKKLARILGITIPEFKVLWDELQPWFVKQDGGLVNQQLEEYRRDREQYRTEQRARGTLGAQARWRHR
jgi:uncharacterized protein YdaU (DUF1376 family)